MAIDPSRFANTIKAIAPVYNRQLYLPKARLQVDLADGWYEAELYGSKVVSCTPYDDAPKVKLRFKAIQVGSIAFFLSWDQVKKTIGADSFALSVVPVIGYEYQEPEPVVLHYRMGKFFFLTIDYASTAVIDINNARHTSNFKGLSPELRHFLVLENARILAKMEEETKLLRKLQEEERTKNLRSIKEEITERFKQVGATVTDVCPSLDVVVVRWHAGFYEGVFETVLDRQTLMIREAGYCASGADKKFNITSLVKTAEEYAESDLIWITRAR